MKGSHDVPAYGFERVVDPPPLDVNVPRLLSEFHAARHHDGRDLARDARRRHRRGRAAPGWRGRSRRTAPASRTAPAASAVDRGDGRRAAAFAFPDDVWARVIFDLVIAARDQPGELEAFVAALVPVYFGRVASSVIENRALSTDEAEESIERQAREFERLKPYLDQPLGRRR